MKFEEPRVSGVVSKAEMAVINGTISLTQPRKEYCNGEIKLNFKYILPSGEIIEAKEDKQGVADIKIWRGDEVVVDFSKFMPKNCRFVTPNYLNTRPFIKDVAGSDSTGKWWSYRKAEIVSIGDMRQPIDIFILLHEIGHVNQNVDQKKQIINDLPASEDLVHKKIRFLSINERNAWARALHITRQIKEKDGVNLFEVFKNKLEFQEFLYASLLSYKLDSRLELSLQGFESIREYLMNAFFGASSQDEQFLDKLFDKGRLGRAQQAKHEKVENKRI